MDGGFKQQMWEFIKGCLNFILLVLLGLKNIVELFVVAAESIHLSSLMNLNSVNITNGKPLETRKELKDLATVDKKTATYLYGVRLLQEQQESPSPLPSDTLLKQHQALEKFIHSLDKLPLQNDYSIEVWRLINQHHGINRSLIPTEAEIAADVQIALIERNNQRIELLNKLKVKLGNDPAAVRKIDDQIAAIKNASEKVG